MGAVAGTGAHAGVLLVAELKAEEGAEIDLFARLQLLALEIAAASMFSLDLVREGPALRTDLQGYAIGIGRPTLLDFLLPGGWPTPRSWARWRFRRRWMARIGDILAARHAAPIADPPRDLFDMIAAGATDDDRIAQPTTP